MSECFPPTLARTRSDPPRGASAIAAHAATDIPTVLVVSEARAERVRLAGLFAEAGFTVLQAGDARRGRSMLAAHLDLVVIQCPALVGETPALCRSVTAGPGSPLLMVLVAEADFVDEIIALELGADDLVSGAAPDRLVLARVRALLRRAAPRPHVDEREPGRWRLNPLTRAAISPAGRSVVLSPRDAAALHLFLTNPGVAFTNETGADRLGTGALSSRAFRTAVCRLRKKLDGLGEGDPIRTARGSGYFYAPTEAPTASAWPISPLMSPRHESVCTTAS